MAATHRKPGRRPKAERNQRTIRVPVDMDHRVSEYADERGISIGDAIVALLASSLDVDEPGYIEAEAQKSKRSSAQAMLRIGA